MIRSREAFAYESNASLLREILVPEPVSQSQWQSILRRWESSGGENSLLKWLVDEGDLAEGTLLSYLSIASGARILAPQYQLEPIGESPESELLEKLGLLPVGIEGGKNLVTGGRQLAPDLSRFLGCEASNWEWVIVSPVRDLHKPTPAAAAEMGTETGLKQLLLGFWSRAVTDIHFERTGDNLHIRVLESGIMRTVDSWHGEAVETGLRLLKTWAGLSTASDSLPQDGRLSLDLQASRIDLRASHITTVNGESLVLRNLEKQSQVRSIHDLGIPPTLTTQVLDIITNEPGLTIISGPTGSGKTTTSYALLNELRESNKKLITIEDPVEQEIPHAVQSEVNLNAGWTFNRAIRAFLRQDPDVIFVGEIRDRESAEAAFRAALTGHCVLATLHAKSNPAALSRIQAWSVPQGMLKDTVRILVNQRLVHDPHSGQQIPRFNWECLDESVAQAV